MLAARAREYAWALTLVLGSALFFIDERTMLDTHNPHFLPSVILLGSAAVPAAFVAFIYGRRLPYDVPVGAVWATAVVGGVIGTVVAGVAEFKTLQELGTLPKIAVGASEEAAKLIVPFFLLMTTRYRRRADGLLIGVASGAGFAALETMGYALVALIVSNGNIGSVQNLLMLRGLLSPAGHMAWTGIAAAVMWDAAAAGWTARATCRFVVAYLSVVALHALWDGVGSIPAYAAIGVTSLMTLAYVTHLVARRARGRRLPRRAAASLGFGAGSRQVTGG